MLYLKKHGDILETGFYNKIINQLPQYEEFWKLFIGNNGNAEIIGYSNRELDSKRQEVAQLSYTIFESLVCLYRIDLKKSKISTLDDYLDANNNFLLFNTHCGRIRDCVKKIGEKLGIHDLHNLLEDFYKKRNIVLHGKKIPFTIIEDSFVLPLINGVDHNTNHWNDSLRWKDVNDLDLEFVNEFFSELYKEMLSCLSSVYSRLLNNIKKDNSYVGLLQMMKEYEPIEDNYVTCSGINNNHIMSDRKFMFNSGSISS